MKKPAWAASRERARRAGGQSARAVGGSGRGGRARRAGGQSVWLFGIHAVRDALINPRRTRLQLVVTRNAADRLAPEIAEAGLAPRLVDARRFDAPLDPASVHQGAALEVLPLDWGSVSETCAPGRDAPVVVLLDRVGDPHNAGAVLRSAEVFGARAVLAPQRHSAPETGALAKAASGALERQPYLRVPNLGRAMAALKAMGYAIVALDGAAEDALGAVLAELAGQPLVLALGAEGPGLRALTRAGADRLAHIQAAGGFGSLNVSNAAAIALYAAARARKDR